MTDTNTPAVDTAAAPATPANESPAKAPKVLTVADDMDSRFIAKSHEDFLNYLKRILTFADFDSYPLAAVGLNEDGTLDPEIYGPGIDIAVETMTKKGEGAGSSVVRAIIVRPNPSVAAMLDNPAAMAWLEKIATKEMNLVATRALRKSEDVRQAVDSMPTKLADYISGREATASMLEAYNEVWDTIKKTLAKAFKSWAMAPLSKKTMRQAMESAAFAKQNFPLLEDRGDQKSMFVIACELGAGLAKRGGHSPEIFNQWLATRDSFEIDLSDDDGDDVPFSVDAALAALDAPAADSTTGADDSATTGGDSAAA